MTTGSDKRARATSNESPGQNPSAIRLSRQGWRSGKMGQIHQGVGGQLTREISDAPISAEFVVVDPPGTRVVNRRRRFP